MHMLPPNALLARMRITARHASIRYPESLKTKPFHLGACDPINIYFFTIVPDRPIRSIVGHTIRPGIIASILLARFLTRSVR
jgi:hypothetical protein